MRKENLYEPDCIITHSGLYVNVFDPKPEMFIIEDIAHALAHQPRFGGHLDKFYSVAQHSVLACREPSSFAEELETLMHDASEAYLMDIPSPIKARLSNYKEIEDGLMKVISEVFQFNYPLSDSVKAVDKIMLEKEWSNLVINKSNSFERWGFLKAKNEFLKAYNECRR